MSADTRMRFSPFYHLRMTSTSQPKKIVSITPIATYDGINYYQASPKTTTPEQVEAISRLIATAFLDEPMKNHMNMNFDRMHKFVNVWMPECIQNESSVFATLADTDTLVGAFICRDFNSPAPSDFVSVIDADFTPIIDVCASWVQPHTTFETDLIVPFPVVDAIDSMHEKRIDENARPPLQVGHAMDLWMAAVAPTARKRNICNHLTHIALDLAHYHEYKVRISCGGTVDLNLFNQAISTQADPVFLIKTHSSTL